MATRKVTQKSSAKKPVIKKRAVKTAPGIAKKAVRKAKARKTKQIQMEQRGVPNDEAMPMVTHMRELRNRLMIVASGFLLALIFAYTQAEPIYQFLVKPLAEARGGANRLIFTALTEPFFTYLKLAFFAAFIVAFPLIAWQLYAFVAPGLYKRERNVLWPFLIASPVLFLIGAALAYYGIFPMAWNFFLSFEVQGGHGLMPIQLEAKVGEYLSLTMHLIIAFGLAFQLPVVLMLLALGRFVTRKGLVSKRKYAIIGIFALAGVLTPPDVISQIGLAIPLLVLYEISVHLCGILEQRQRDNE